MNTSMTAGVRGTVQILCAAGILAAGGCRAGDGTRGPSSETSSRTGPAPVVDVNGAQGIVNPEFLEQYAATRGFSHGTPKSIAITPDGSAVLFLRSGPRSFVQDLYLLETATGRERVLLTAEGLLGGGEEKLTAEELARRERMRMASRGIASFQLSKDGKQILLPLSGKLFVVELATGKSREVASQAAATGSPIDPRFSPDGAKIACVRDGDLYVTDLASGAETRLTTRASPTITNGLAEFVAQEEMDRFQGYWWSPDSNWIAFEEADTAGMETFHIADSLNPGKEADSWPYPRPGKQNAKVRLGVIAARGGQTTWVNWDPSKYEYLARVTWAKNAPLCLLLQNRAQTEQVLLAVDNSGATRELLRETDSAWLNLTGSFPKWLKDASGFLWMTEARGAWQLELRKADGTLNRVLTPPQLGAESVVGVDERALGGWAYITTADEPTQTHLWRIPLDPGAEGAGKPERLTSEPGRHGLVLAEDSDWCVHTASLGTGELRWTARRLVRTGMPGGSAPGDQHDLRTTREAPAWTPRLEIDTVGARQMRAAIIRPRSFERGRKYPVVVNVYGGPHAKTVHSTPTSYFLQQWIADQGFIVVCMDGRGTPSRGRDWERAIHKDLIDPALDDQVAGLQALGARHTEMDLSRVGIYGWSFGGYFSALAAMKRPDVFRAGVAGAPVADWMDYDTHYTERYMGLPGDAGGADAYARSNVLSWCKDLRRPLLIIHGTSDDNVYFMHSLKMTQELFRAGRHFEFLPLAGFTHMVPDPLVTTRLYTRIAEFLRRNVAESR